MVDTDRQTVGWTQSNVYAFLGTAGTYHNKPKTLLDTADRVQYPYADAYGGLIALPAPKVSETGNPISYGTGVFGAYRSYPIFYRQRSLWVWRCVPQYAGRLHRIYYMEKIKPLRKSILNGFLLILKPINTAGFYSASFLTETYAKFGDIFGWQEPLKKSL